jgi:hypothetical protein
MVLGITATVMWGTQQAFNWFGQGYPSLQMIYSIITLAMLAFAIGFTYVAGARIGSKVTLRRPPMHSALRIGFLVFLGAAIFILFGTGFGMTMDSQFASYAESDLGFLTGFRMLTSVTSQDASLFTTLGYGLKQFFSALFAIVPILIAIWGALSLVTADSVDEAEGAITSLLAAGVVFIIVWLFKFLGVNLLVV